MISGPPRPASRALRQEAAQHRFLTRIQPAFRHLPVDCLGAITAIGFRARSSAEEVCAYLDAVDLAASEMRARYGEIIAE